MLRFDIPIVKMLYLVSLLGLNWNGLFNRLWWIFDSRNLNPLIRSPAWKRFPFGQGLLSKLLNLTVMDYMGRPCQDHEPPPNPSPHFFEPEAWHEKRGGENNGDFEKKKMLVEATPHSESHCGFQDFKLQTLKWNKLPLHILYKADLLH